MWMVPLVTCSSEKFCLKRSVSLKNLVIKHILKVPEAAIVRFWPITGGSGVIFTVLICTWSEAEPVDQRSNIQPQFYAGQTTNTRAPRSFATQNGLVHFVKSDSPQLVQISPTAGKGAQAQKETATRSNRRTLIVAVWKWEGEVAPKKDDTCRTLCEQTNRTHNKQRQHAEICCVSLLLLRAAEATRFKTKCEASDSMLHSPIALQRPPPSTTLVHQICSRTNAPSATGGRLYVRIAELIACTQDSHNVVLLLQASIEHEQVLVSFHLRLLLLALRSRARR